MWLLFAGLVCTLGSYFPPYLYSISLLILFTLFPGIHTQPIEKPTFLEEFVSRNYVGLLSTLIGLTATRYHPLPIVYETVAVQVLLGNYPCRLGRFVLLVSIVSQTFMYQAGIPLYLTFLRACVDNIAFRYLGFRAYIEKGICFLFYFVFTTTR